VFILHASHHSGVVSTSAIRRLGYADPRDLPDVDNGWVERDAAGVPTGVLAERALQLVYEALRPEPFEVMVEAIRLGAQAALSEGLTSVTEPGIGGMLTGNGPVDLAAFQAARDRGHLGVRTTVMPELSALHALVGGHPDDGPDPLGLDLGLRTGLGDDDLRIGGVKVFADGALTARTAALREPYLDRPDTCGFLLEDRETLHERIVAAHRAGWQVATHAIGDAAVDVTLDAYEDAQRRFPREGTRHRIEHCGITHDDQIPRLAALGVVPVPQGRFLSELGDAYLPGIGEERAQLLYRQRAFLDAGLEVPGSSDCPVVSGAPLAGIAALVERTIPGGRTLGEGERLTAHEALRAFTYGSAFADLQEHRKGTLTVGKLADVTVLSDDPTQVDTDRIAGLEVVATIVGGEVRYHRTGP
jgi:predicted amidohydrolase YtcJ